jgi:hypothetical protein
VPEQSKKLSGFEALYQVDQEKHSQKVGASEAKPSKEAVVKPPRKQRESAKKENGKESNKVSKSESNIVSRFAGDVFEPTTFKADRRKVLALKRLALNLEPARKLQDLFDEALADILAKYGHGIE